MDGKRLFLYALCGSLRRASSNRALLEALQFAAPAGVTIEISDMIGDLPIFNPDREGSDTPEIVERFAAKIRAADGLIVACPEYAHGLPGGFKNALDWLVSRDEVPFKPVMIAHASHRGDDALAQLQEVLRTMSLIQVEAAFLRVPLLGKTMAERNDVLGSANMRGRLENHLSLFLAGVREARGVRHPCTPQ